jgi:outer membrane immunogenic protein
VKYLALPLALGAAIATGIAAPAAAQTFDGPYVGAQAGWSQNRLGSVDTDLGKAGIDDKRDSATAGIFVGYNLQPTAGVVLSAEGAVNFGFDDGLARSQKDASAAINPEYGFDLGIRAGYLVTDKTLVYARGGYENVRTAVRILDLEGPRRGKDNLDGWSVGGGVERAITDHISARVEYRYSDLGSGGTKWDRHQVLAGVAWNF